MESIAYPIFDLHCDLLIYLATTPNATAYDTEGIGATVPYFKKGNVKFQVMAAFAPTGNESVELGEKQFDSFLEILELPDFHAVTNKKEAHGSLKADSIGIIPAIENASVLCDETESLENAFRRFDKILEAVQHIFYISFTHHTENRFGGGNYSDNVGLKEDGKALLEYLHQKKIAVDLSHTSDNLAIGIMDHIEAKSLDVPIIASHSNFRILHDHVRNLPDEFVQHLVRNKGLIGMNFLRAYIHDTDPDYFIEHFLHGLHPTVAPDQLVFGADFFYRPVLEKMFPERIPIFFDEHIDATKYPNILTDLSREGIGEELLEKLCYQNVLDFIDRVW